MSTGQTKIESRPKIVCFVESSKSGRMLWGQAAQMEVDLSKLIARRISKTTEFQAVASESAGKGGRGATTSGIATAKFLLAAGRAMVKIPFLALVQHRILESFIKTRPTFNVHLSISLRDQTVDRELGNLAASLLMIACIETHELRTKYPSYRIGYSIGISNDEEQFDVKYKVMPNQISSDFDSRIVYAATGLKFMEGLYLTITVTAARFIRHEVLTSIIVGDKDRRFDPHGGKLFFTFFSRRVAGGYVWRQKRMNLPEYLKYSGTIEP